MVAHAMKDKTDAFDKLSMFLSSASNSDDLKETTQHAVGGPVAQTGLLASLTDSIGKSQPGTDQNSPTRQLENVLQTATGQTWKPTPKLDANNFAKNAEGNRAEGQAKIVDAKDKMVELRANVEQIANKMGDAPQPSGAGKGVASALVTEAAFAAVGLPGAGLAVAAAKAMMGQGTAATHDKASEYSFIDYRKGSKNDTPYRPAPSEQPKTSAAAPQQANPLLDKLNNGPGFGRYDLLADRSSLAGQTLNGITAINLEKTIEKSPAMRQYQDQMQDGQAVERIHLAMQKRGLETADGKQSTPEVAQMAYQAPAQPPIQTFRT